jgi:ABC-type nickel/cobalt efflux system permease component RcnA/ABC-type uncharacterized transport system substrate-binding protein
MRYIFVIVLFLNTLFGCAACQLSTPTCKIDIKLQIKEKRVKNIDMSWRFSKKFFEETLIQYDKNSDNLLSKDELKKIEDSLVDYLLPKSMLTQISHSYNGVDSNIDATYTGFNLLLKDSILILSYSSIVDIDIKDETTLSFTFKYDPYFDFVIDSFSLDDSSIKYTKNLYLFSAFILFGDSNSEEIELNSIKLDEVNRADIAEEIEENSSFQSGLLKDSIIKIKALFEEIKDETNPLSYIALLFFAYIYGVIHALGPGHGKTLVASYFLINERSYSKAIFISLAIGVVHTFSAFILTIFIYYIVDSLLSQFLDDTVYYTTKISALIIIAIALYLFYQKYRAYKQSKKQSFTSFSKTPHTSSCSCGSCRVDKNSTDIALIISAGIIPCPGTITIFIFTISLGLYFAGFLSALVMSLGMSTIIFLSALLSVAIRQKSSKNSDIKKYLEYGSIVIILILGLILLFA